MKEADLYPDLKAYLEGQGYAVKSEIGACDVMAIRGQEPPVIVEMKLSLTLGLVLQGVARQAMFDHVYLAVPRPPKSWPARYKDIIVLLRRLGLGLLVIRPGQVEAHLDPGPYQPRKATARAKALLREYHRRVGDPNLGGTTRVKRMTSYRQDALRCLDCLSGGARKGADVAGQAKVARATEMMRTNHYGWFDRVGPGQYALSAAGQIALAENAAEIARLRAAE
jgi:hypothetical protein